MVWHAGQNAKLEHNKCDRADFERPAKGTPLIRFAQSASSIEPDRSVRVGFHEPFEPATHTRQVAVAVRSIRCPGHDALPTLRESIPIVVGDRLAVLPRAGHSPMMQGL